MKEQITVLLSSRDNKFIQAAIDCLSQTYQVRILPISFMDLRTRIKLIELKN